MSKKKNTPAQPAAPQTSQAAPSRTKTEVDAEYSQICAQLGERQYRVSRIQLEIAAISNRIDGLHQEANAIQALAQNAAPVAAAVEPTK